MGFVERLVYMRKNKYIYPFVNVLLLLLQVEIPRNVILGNNLKLGHRGMGVVINPNTRIGNNVTILHQVTIGSATPWDDSLMVKHAQVQEGGGKFCY